MPGAFPQSMSPPSRDSTPVPSKRVKRANLDTDATPKNGTPIKPSDEEMHPQLHHQTTTKPFDDARHLGFTKMGAFTEPPKQASKIATLQGTPTRASKADPSVSSPKFQFTFCREHSLELSPEAKKLMNEKREEAARIREQMVANGASEQAAVTDAARKTATPNTKKGRFSEAHSAHFEKMTSIAGHASAFRAKPAPPNPVRRVDGHEAEAGQKSLKRSPSKAQLDEPNHAARVLHRSPSKPTLAGPSSQLPRSTSSKTLTTVRAEESPSPAKRVKRTETDDVSVARPSSDSNRSLPTTPQPSKVIHKQPSNANLSSLASPTLASLARASSINPIGGTKIPGPQLVRSPSKPNLAHLVAQDSPKPMTPLLARSPSKAALFPTHKVDNPQATMSPLLARTPLRASPSKRSAYVEMTDKVRTPELAPLLARSPLKISIAKPVELDEGHHKKSSVPLLAQSPAKIPISKSNGFGQATYTPGKTVANALMGRFNLLRSSPMKSILRSPQRLYSDDPAKVAAGTHLATPPKQRIINKQETATASNSAQKHVDFTSSTKARDEVRSQSRTPSKSPTPTCDTATPAPVTEPEATVVYPTLPARDMTPSPEKRRQTAVPNDFTFRAGEHGIVFGQSPSAPPGVQQHKRPSTIRHVSADVMMFPAPAAGSKKRKFEFKNDVAITDDKVESAHGEDKENADENVDMDEQRPAKRAKANPLEREASASPEKKTTRLPTLGVKPKGGAKTGQESKKKPSTISKARLNALSQPKRRT